MYYFKCLECEEKSEPLGKDYCRLVSKKWVCKKHKKEDDKVIRKFKGGYIIKDEEF